MKLFKSNKERWLWIGAVAVLLAIYATAFVGQPLVSFLRDLGLQDTAFTIGVVLIAVTVIFQRVRLRPGWGELGVWLGVAAVYLLLFLRIETPAERTHLIEYTVLATFIYRALTERVGAGNRILVVAVSTVVVTALLGLVDEGIQYLVPNRVFDLWDIGFNALAGLVAVVAALSLGLLERGRASKQPPQ